MTPDERKRFDLSFQYALYRVTTLKFEIDLLSIESKALFDLSKQLNDYKTNNISPKMDTDLRYDDIFWKWSEQAQRYHHLGMAVSEIFKEKARQIQDILNAVKSDFEKAGLEVPDFVEIPIKDGAIDNDGWDNIITGFEDRLDNSDGRLD